MSIFCELPSCEPTGFESFESQVLVDMLITMELLVCQRSVRSRVDYALPALRKELERRDTTKCCFSHPLVRTVL